MYELNLLDLITIEKLVNQEIAKARVNGHTAKHNELTILRNKLQAKQNEFGLK